MKGLLFCDVQDMKDVKEVIQKNFFILENLPLDDIMIHYENLVNLPLKLENQFLDFVHHVDESFSFYGYYGFFTQKISTILVGATYYQEHYQKIHDLSVQEVAILAKYSVVNPVSDYSLNIQKFSKEILRTISEKTNDFIMRDELMTFIDLVREEGQSEEILCRELKEESLPDLVKTSYQLQEKLLEERDFYDSRRI